MKRLLITIIAIAICACIFAFATYGNETDFNAKDKVIEHMQDKYEFIGMTIDELIPTKDESSGYDHYECYVITTYTEKESKVYIGGIWWNDSNDYDIDIDLWESGK